MGFRKSGPCVRLAHVLRVVVETPTDRRTLLFVARLVFACTYDSVLHSAVICDMARRSVPEPFATATYVRDMRNSEVVFEHGGWRKKGIYPTVGLRQGCSVSPLLLRRVMEDLVALAREDWSAQPCGVWVDTELLQILAGADDTWPFEATQAQGHRMFGTSCRLAKGVAGLGLRLEHVNRQNCADESPPRAKHPRNTPSICNKWAKTPPGTCLK